MVDAQESGIRAIPLGLSQIVAVVICSYLVTRFGFYVGVTSSDSRKAAD